MSDFKHVKEVSRIIRQKTSEDGVAIETVRNLDLFDVSDGEEPKNEERTNWRVSKRKKLVDEECDEPSAAQWGEVLKISSTIPKPKEKRFKADIENTKFSTSLQVKRKVGRPRKKLTSETASNDSLQNQNVIKEISERTGLSQSYLLKTDAVRKLAESFFAIKESRCMQQIETRKSSKISLTDALSKMSITSGETEPRSESITLRGNKKCDGVSSTLKTISPLRAFRLHRHKDRKAEEPTVKKKRPVGRPRTKPLNVAKEVTSTDSKPRKTEGSTQSKILKKHIHSSKQLQRLRNKMCKAIRPKKVETHLRKDTILPTCTATRQLNKPESSKKKCTLLNMPKGDTIKPKKLTKSDYNKRILQKLKVDRINTKELRASSQNDQLLLILKDDVSLPQHLGGKTQRDKKTPPQKITASQQSNISQRDSNDEVTQTQKLNELSQRGLSLHNLDDKTIQSQETAKSDQNYCSLKAVKNKKVQPNKTVRSDQKDLLVQSSKKEVTKPNDLTVSDQNDTQSKEIVVLNKNDPYLDISKDDAILLQLLQQPKQTDPSLKVTSENAPQNNNQLQEHEGADKNDPSLKNSNDDTTQRKEVAESSQKDPIQPQTPEIPNQKVHSPQIPNKKSTKLGRLGQNKKAAQSQQLGSSNVNDHISQVLNIETLNPQELREPDHHEFLPISNHYTNPLLGRSSYYYPSWHLANNYTTQLQGLEGLNQNDPSIHYLNIKTMQQQEIELPNQNYQPLQLLNNYTTQLQELGGPNQNDPPLYFLDVKAIQPHEQNYPSLQLSNNYPAQIQELSGINQFYHSLPISNNNTTQPQALAGPNQCDPLVRILNDKSIQPKELQGIDEINPSLPILSVQPMQPMKPINSPLHILSVDTIQPQMRLYADFNQNSISLQIPSVATSEPQDIRGFNSNYLPLQISNYNISLPSEPERPKQKKSKSRAIKCKIDPPPAQNKESNKKTKPQFEQKRKTVLSRHVSLPLPIEVISSITKQTEPEEHDSDEFSKTFFEKLTLCLKEYEQSKPSQDEPGEDEINVQKPLQGFWRKKNSNYVAELSPQEKKYTTCEPNILSDRSTQQLGPKTNNSHKPINDDGGIIMQDQQHVKLARNGGLNESLDLLLQYEEQVGDEALDTSLQKPTSEEGQMSQSERFKPRTTSLDTPVHFGSNILKRREQAASEGDYDDHSQQTLLQNSSVEQHWRSGAIEQMTEDVSDVEMAAEALNFLKFKGKINPPISEEYHQSKSSASVKMSHVKDCANSHDSWETGEVGFDVQYSSNPENDSSGRILPESLSKQRVLFDSTLEITDAVTGVKIPFESLNLNDNENSSNEIIDLKNCNGDDDTDTYMRLSDSVTCVKVPIQTHISPLNEETTTDLVNESDTPVTEMVSDISKCPEYNSVVLPRNEDITREKIESRYAALQQLEVENNLSFNKKCQLSDGKICVHVPLEVINFSKPEDILNDENRSAKGEEQKSTLVKIRLDAIYLPKCAATGVKIPLDSSSWPRNILNGEMESSSNQENVENNFESTNKSNEDVHIPLPKNALNSITKNQHGGNDQFGKCQMLDTKNIELPLKLIPQNQEQNVSSETINTKDQNKHILELPKIVLNEVSELDEINQEEDQNLDRMSSQDSNTSNIKIKCNTEADSSVNDGSVKDVTHSLQHRKSQNENNGVELNAHQQDTNETERNETYIEISDDTESTRSGTPSLVIDEDIDMDEFPKSPQQVTESDSEPVEVYSRVSVIQKALIQFDEGISAKKGDKTNSVDENGNTGCSDMSVVGDIKTPRDAFTLLINDDMIRRIIKYTNWCIEKLSQFPKWKSSCFKFPCNEIEINAFLGLLFVSSAFRQNQSTIEELWSDSYGPGIYRAALSEQRFQILSICICSGETSIMGEEKDLKQEYLNNCKKYSMLAVPCTTNEKTDDNYSTVRKTANTSLQNLFTILDGAALLGWDIFRCVNSNTKINQREFLKQLGMSMIRDHLHARELKLNLRRKDKDMIEYILSNGKCDNELSLISTGNFWKKQKRCQICPWSRNRKTKYRCYSCHRAMCKDHRTDLCVECVKHLI